MLKSTRTEDPVPYPTLVCWASLVPRPFKRRRRRREGLVHIAHACAGDPRKMQILSYACTLRLSPIELYVMHAEPMNDHYGNATGRYGDPSACMCSVYQVLSPPPLEGPGNEAIWRASPFPVVKGLAHQTNPTCPPRELLSN